ncbi:hypothetical protein HDU92_000264, partial [Lobulomyces angularis]
NVNQDREMEEVEDETNLTEDETDEKIKVKLNFEDFSLESDYLGSENEFAIALPTTGNSLNIKEKKQEGQRDIIDYVLNRKKRIKKEKTNTDDSESLKFEIKVEDSNRKEKKTRKKKKKTTPYQQYILKCRNQIKNEYPNETNSSITNLLRNKWNEYSEAEKEEYNILATIHNSELNMRTANASSNEEENEEVENKLKKKFKEKSLKKKKKKNLISTTKVKIKTEIQNPPVEEKTLCDNKNKELFSDKEQNDFLINFTQIEKEKLSGQKSHSSFFVNSDQEETTIKKEKLSDQRNYSSFFVSSDQEEITIKKKNLENIEKLDFNDIENSTFKKVDIVGDSDDLTTTDEDIQKFNSKGSSAAISDQLKNTDPQIFNDIITTTKSESELMEVKSENFDKTDFFNESDDDLSTTDDDKSCLNKSICFDDTKNERVEDLDKKVPKTVDDGKSVVPKESNLDKSLPTVLNSTDDVFNLFGL